MADKAPVTITRFQAENFMRLKAVDIEVGADGKFVALVGKGRAGKTSILKGIQAAMGGKNEMPSQPVRKGEAEGVVVAELSNGLRVRRIFDAEGGGSLVVENMDDGARHTAPQAVLNKLYSSVAFDPINFMRLDPKDQLATLRRMVTLDVDLDAIAARDKEDYDARRDVNRDITQIEGQLAGLQLPAERPAVEDEAKLLAELTGAAERNGQIERRRAGREEFTRQASDLTASIADMEEQLAAAKSRRDDLQKRLDDAEPLPEPIDTAEVQAKLEAARAARTIVEGFNRRDELTQALEVKRLASQRFTDAILERGKAKAKAFEAANMPVAGLSFGDGEVLFNGLPLDQAGGSELLKISAEIAIASAPDLKVMLIHEASVLDAADYEYLRSLSEERSVQIWLASLDTTGRTGVVIEDGEVAGAAAPEPIDKGGRRKKPAEAAQEAAEPPKADAEAPENQKPADEAPAASEALIAAEAKRVEGQDGEKKTLFERMSDVARGTAAQAGPAPKVEPDPDPTPPATGESMFD